MRKSVFIVSIFVGFMAVAAEAEIYQCTGVDDIGNPVLVTVDFFTNIFNVNGKIHTVVSRSANPLSVNTENFPITDNLFVYDSFTIDKNNYYLIQFNAYTNKPLFSANLTCHK